MVIEPTNGRIVWYRPALHDGVPNNGGQPLAAIVVHVWNLRLVNLCIFDSNGVPRPKTSVMLVQEGDAVPAAGGYCEWMPWQKGQAAKTEALEKKVSGAA